MDFDIKKKKKTNLEGAVDIPAEGEAVRIPLRGEAVRSPLRGEVVHIPRLQGAAGDIPPVQGSHQ